jgi:hypothetical protein
MIHCPELSEENVVRYWQMNHNTMSTACKKYSTRLTKLWCRDGKGGVDVESIIWILRVVKYSIEYLFFSFSKSCIWTIVDFEGFPTARFIMNAVKQFIEFQMNS